MDTCNSFAELVLGYDVQTDFHISIVDRGADITVTAIHGGLIEPLVSELAATIAGLEHNLYELQGLTKANAAGMRIPTSRYSEMRLNALIKRSGACIALDGVPDEAVCVHIGGKNGRLKQLLADQLMQAGFTISGPYSPGAAHDPTRYYNTAKDGGVLLELSQGLRATMVNGPLTGTDIHQPTAWSERFHEFILAVTSAVESYLEYVQTDLDLAVQRFEETTRQLPRSLRSGHHHKQEP